MKTYTRINVKTKRLQRMVVADADGFVRFTRLKDMIIRGSEDICPREIEGFLFEHPKVTEVTMFGEQVMMWVQLHKGLQATEPELCD